MLWLHTVVARGFVRHRWKMLLAYTVLLVSASLVFSTGYALVREVEYDVARTAEQLAFDIVILDGEPDADVEELAETLSRRPDVLTSRVLSREAVWLMFQSEIGVQSEGMAEVAALPRIIRLHMRSEYVNSRHLQTVVRGLQRRYAGQIETVLVPKASVRNVEKRQAELQTLTISARSASLVLFLGIAIAFGRTIRRRNLAQLASMHGSSSTSLLRAPFGVLLMASILSIGLSLAGSLLVVPWLVQSFHWVRGDVVQQLFMQTTIAAVSVPMLVHVIMSLWPLPASQS
ncbi:MAG: hypothetical protein RL594_841 [Bacteroidota bacterium]|jgi:cell division protein FtsX